MASKTIKELRIQSGLSQAAFGSYYGIPKRNIENWEQGQRQCPDYVIKMLERLVAIDFKE